MILLLIQRNFFLRKIRENPELEYNFQEQLTEEFKAQMEEKGVYFIVNIIRAGLTKKKPTLRLSICGQEEVPTISLDY